MQTFICPFDIGFPFKFNIIFIEFREIKIILWIEIHTCNEWVNVKCQIVIGISMGQLQVHSNQNIRNIIFKMAFKSIFSCEY